MAKDHEKIVIYQVGRGLNWRRMQAKKARPLESVILDGGNAKMLMEDIANFKQSGDWYIGKGVPFRRGYMLYGPPGTGKTSFT